MSVYETFPVTMEPKSLHELSARILSGRPYSDRVVDAELLNFANEIDSRMQRVAVGLTKVETANTDWLEL